MDVRNNAPLIAAGGGLLLFISLFLNWFGAEGLDVTASAWEAFDVIDVILAIIGLIAVAVGAMLATGNTTNLPAAPAAIVTTAGVVAIAIVANWILDSPDGTETKFGIWLALIATIAIIVGGRQLGAASAAPRTRVQEPPPPPPPPPPPASPTV